MAAHSSIQKRIKNALVSVLTDVTYDTGSGAEPAFVSVLDSTEGQFDGYPSVRVFPSHIDDEEVASHENERVVSYTIRTHIPLEETAESGSQAFDQMYDLAELIIDTLDQGDYDDVLHQKDASLNTLSMSINQADWTIVAAQSGAVLMFDIVCQVRYSKQLQ